MIGCGGGEGCYVYKIYERAFVVFNPDAGLTGYETRLLVLRINYEPRSAKAILEKALDFVDSQRACWKLVEPTSIAQSSGLVGWTFRWTDDFVDKYFIEGYRPNDDLAYLVTYWTPSETMD